MKTLKKFILLALTLILTTAMFPTTVSASGSDNETELLPIDVFVFTVGDAVTAEFYEESGTLEFYSNNGVLWHNWYDHIGVSRQEIINVRAAASSGTINFPEDSSDLFRQFGNLVTVDFRKFDTSNAADMSGLFSGCTSIKKLDLSNFNAANVTRMDSPFYNCGKLEILRTPKNLSADAGLGSVMYDAEGAVYNKLPGSSKSIRLGKTQKLAYEFSDVTDMTSWYFDAVCWAYNNNITAGFNDGSFGPDKLLTRAQAVTFLYNIAGKPDVSVYPDPGFKDVTEKDWFYRAVRWAASNKITSGFGPGSFKPDTVCSRAMIVTFLKNYAVYAGLYRKPTTSSDFTDVDPGIWYKGAVDWAVENKITSGMGAGTFKPDKTCTRAMMVVFLKKLSELSPI